MRHARLAHDDNRHAVRDFAPASVCRRAQRSRAAPDLARVHADAPGIAWFNGDVDAAFKSAKASNKPVLLYWGAQWCPPCKQLKSAVFSRPDFIEKSKLFVAVYLDGDLPDAQKWGDVFRVTGYPTVVVLQARSHRDHAHRRQHGPVAVRGRARRRARRRAAQSRMCVALAIKADTPLAATDCRRLAYHAFDLEDEGVFEAAQLQSAFENARAPVPGGAHQGARASPYPGGGGQRPPAEGRHREGRQGGQTLTVLIVRVNELLANKELAMANEDALRGLPKAFYLGGAPDPAADRAGYRASA